MATTENFLNGDGTAIEFSFSFPYIKTEDVRVELQEIDSTQPINNQIISSTAVTLFTIPSNNPTVIQFDSLSAATNYQAITGAPLANHAINTGNTIRIRIYRSTSTTATPATFFSGGAIRSQDLNDNFDSILYITQEKENQLTEVIAGGIADGSITTSKLADQSVTPAKLADQSVTPAKLDRTYVDTTGDTMTGGLIVPSLSSPSGNLPIQRASVADSQVQSFQVQDDDFTNWYPFNPIPTWCNHVRYNISVALSTNQTTSGGFYFRWGSAAGPLLANEVSNAGSKATVLDYESTILYSAEPLVVHANTLTTLYYDSVMDFYIYNRGINSVPGFYCYGRGKGSFNNLTPLQAQVAEVGMAVQHITPQSPNTVMPDRLGCLFFGGTASGVLNYAQVKQTFMTDGPVGLQADLGPTPTPIP